MPQRILLTTVVLFVALGAGTADAQPVVAVRGLTLDDLPALARHGAVGLLVPNAGPTTSAALALAGIERGALHNARLGPRPDGPVLIHVRTASAIPSARGAVMLALPPARAVRNDQRYPIAVLGACRGILVSARTRVPGLVSAADIAPHALRCRSGRDAATTLQRLESRIETARATTFPALLIVLFTVLALAVVAPAAALPALYAGLAANLALGLVPEGGAEPRLALFALCTIGGGLTRRALPGTAVVAAYAVAMAVQPVALSFAPLSPELTGRFYGVSNVVETLLLVPALAGAAQLGRRFGPPAFAGAAVLAIATVAENRLGDDAGGALVLAVGFAVLGTLLGRRVLSSAVATVTAVALLGIDALVSSADHLRSALSLSGLLAVVEHRVPLAYARAAPQWYLLLPFGAALSLLTRCRSHPVALALGAALAVSLLVNDSPEAVVLAGLASLVALEARIVHDALPRPLVLARARA